MGPATAPETGVHKSRSWIYVVGGPHLQATTGHPDEGCPVTSIAPVQFLAGYSLDRRGDELPSLTIAACQRSGHGCAEVPPAAGRSSCRSPARTPCSEESG